VSAARKLSIPLRHFTDDIRYCGDFYGQTTTGAALPESISPTALIRIVSGLGPGTIELACHPGGPDPDLSTMYRDERAAEVDSLCDPRVRSELERRDVQLCSFRDLRRGCEVVQ
jgi:predicted glycoside hydrolase/deacetylase ChbG (UPF0249 family)